MSMNYAYNFARIDSATNMCMAVQSSSSSELGENWVRIPVYDEEYLFKYYNWDDEKFYYDAAYTQEFISALL